MISFIVIAIATLTLIFSIPFERGLRNTFFPLGPANAQFNPALDPKIGTVFSFLGKSQPATSKPQLVIYAGGCSECSIKRLDISSLVKSHYSRITFIFSLDRMEIDAKLLKLKEPFQIIADPQMKIDTEINAVFTPRFYLVSPNNHLLALQMDQGAEAIFVKRRK